MLEFKCNSKVNKTSKSIEGVVDKCVSHKSVGISLSSNYTLLKDH